MPGATVVHKFSTTQQPSLRQVVKRVLELTVTLLALPCCLPLFLLIALAIKLDSPGPIFYRAQRIGYHGRPFTEYKFRSMVADADDTIHRRYVQTLLRQTDGPWRVNDTQPQLYKLAADPRVTRVGRWLRKTSLDELPQLLNVLKGEMSLVGPRPEVPYALPAYQPWQWRRFAVRPGITGLWQVNGRALLSPQAMLRLDVDYVERQSLWLDLKILAKTLAVVVGGKGAG
ncbi:MAG TPA: sugar transferase [Caldilineaceae bacterium]|nr:sugar transferase [Caldilineaceae bacterium]